MKRQIKWKQEQTGKNSCVAFVALVATMAGMASGCRMADNVYDYCSPVFSGRGGEESHCDPLYRDGSIYYNNSNAKLATAQKPTQPQQSPPNNSERIPSAAPLTIPALEPSTVTPIAPPRTNGESGNGNGSSNAPRFRPPVTPTPTPTPLPLPPVDALPPPPIKAPQKPVDHGVTLESLRALDPSITEVEIVDIRD